MMFRSESAIGKQSRQSKVLNWGGRKGGWAPKLKLAHPSHPPHTPSIAGGPGIPGSWNPGKSRVVFACAQITMCKKLKAFCTWSISRGYRKVPSYGASVSQGFQPLRAKKFQFHRVRSTALGSSLAAARAACSCSGSSGTVGVARMPRRMASTSAISSLSA